MIVDHLHWRDDISRESEVAITRFDYYDPKSLEPTDLFEDFDPSGTVQVLTKFRARVQYESFEDVLEGETPDAVRDALEAWIRKMHEKVHPRDQLDFVATELRKRFGNRVRVDWARMGLDMQVFETKAPMRELAYVHVDAPFSHDPSGFKVRRVTRELVRKLMFELR